MARKSKSKGLNILYLIGMVVTVIGFVCPLFEADLGIFGRINSNGFDFIDFDKSSFVSIGALLIFIGAVAGIVASFLPMLKNYKLLCLIVTILGGIVIFIGFATGNDFYKAIAKEFFRYSAIGLYLVAGGWVLSLIGFLMKK